MGVRLYENGSGSIGDRGPGCHSAIYLPGPVVTLTLHTGIPDALKIQPPSPDLPGFPFDFTDVQGRIAGIFYLSPLQSGKVAGHQNDKK